MVAGTGRELPMNSHHYHDWMKDHILVTGSAGRIGQAAVKALVAAELPVIGFDMYPTPGIPLECSIMGTLGDADLIDRAAKRARLSTSRTRTMRDSRGVAPKTATTSSPSCCRTTSSGATT